MKVIVASLLINILSFCTLFGLAKYSGTTVALSEISGMAAVFLINSALFIVASIVLVVFKKTRKTGFYLSFIPLFLSCLVLGMVLVLDLKLLGFVAILPNALYFLAAVLMTVKFVMSELKKNVSN